MKMAAWAKEAGLPKPEVLEIQGAVMVRFQRKTTGKIDEETTGKTIGENDRENTARGS